MAVLLFVLAIRSASRAMPLIAMLAIGGMLLSHMGEPQPPHPVSVTTSPQSLNAVMQRLRAAVQ